VSVASAQEGEGRRVTATALLVGEDGVTPAQVTNIGVGVRRGIEADRRLRFADPVELLSDASVPEEIHEAAYLHAKAFEQRRDAGRLPRP
jgi:hypothetical protein